MRFNITLNFFSLQRTSCIQQATFSFNRPRLSCHVSSLVDICQILFVNLMDKCVNPPKNSLLGITWKSLKNITKRCSNWQLQTFMWPSRICGHPVFVAFPHLWPSRFQSFPSSFWCFYYVRPVTISMIWKKLVKSQLRNFSDKSKQFHEFCGFLTCKTWQFGVTLKSNINSVTGVVVYCSRIKTKLQPRNPFWSAFAQLRFAIRSVRCLFLNLSKKWPPNEAIEKSTYICHNRELGM